MATRDSQYKFVYSPIFLGLFMLSLLASSLYLSGSAYSPPKEIWIPLLSGFTDPAFYSASTSVLLTLAATGVSATMVFMINSKYVGNEKKSITLILLYLIIVMAVPGTIFLRGSTLAAPFFLMAVYNAIKTSESEKSIFHAGFLTATASLLDPHILATLPFIFYFTLVSSSFSFRSIALFITSVVLPFLFLFALRYIVFNDALLFAELFKNYLLSASSPTIKIERVADLFLVLFSFFLAYRAVSNLLGRLSTFKITNSITITRFTIVLLVFLVLATIHPDLQDGFMYLLAIPSAFILNEYLSNAREDKIKRVELLILLILVAVSRISEFL